MSAAIKAALLVATAYYFVTRPSLPVNSTRHGGLLSWQLQQPNNLTVGLSSHEVGPNCLTGGGSCAQGPMEQRGLRSSADQAPAQRRPAPQCVEGANDKQRVCTLRDVYILDGRLYYVLPSAAAAAEWQPPRVHMRWMTVDHLRPGTDWLSNGTLGAVSAEGLRALSAGREESVLEDVVLWQTWTVANYGKTMTDDRG